MRKPFATFDFFQHSLHKETFQLPALIAVIHWVDTCFADQLYFDYASTKLVVLE